MPIAPRGPVRVAVPSATLTVRAHRRDGVGDVAVRVHLAIGPPWSRAVVGHPGVQVRPCANLAVGHGAYEVGAQHADHVGVDQLFFPPAIDVLQRVPVVGIHRGVVGLAIAYVPGTNTLTRGEPHPERAEHVRQEVADHVGAVLPRRPAIGVLPTVAVGVLVTELRQQALYLREAVWPGKEVLTRDRRRVHPYRPHPGTKPPR